MGDFLPPAAAFKLYEIYLGNRPVKGAHHLHVRAKRIPDPAFEIFALAEAADQEDQFDPFLGLLYLPGSGPGSR